MKVLQLRLPSNELDELRRQADERGWSMNALIREAVTKFLGGLREESTTHN